MQPEQKGHIKRQARAETDQVITASFGLGNRQHQLGSSPPLDQNSVHHGIGQERPEQNDRGEVAIGDEMGERLELDRCEHRVPHFGFDLAREVGGEQQREHRQHQQ